MENYYDPIEEQFNRIQASKSQDYQKKKNVEFNVKNYLNVRLAPGEKEKRITVRIVGTEGQETPFTEVYMHYSPSLKKSYVCAKHTNGLSEKTEKTCPFCDIRDEAKEMQRKGNNEATWAKFKDMYKQNTAVLSYVVRVIDRDDEDFGIKFWKFNQNTYENIIDIYKNNKIDDINIFDPKEGKDIIITVKKKDNKNKITNISAANKQTPLAKDEATIESLVNDEKVWTDVYGVKPYDYLDLLLNNKVPFFNKATNKWEEKKDIVSHEDEDNDSDDCCDNNEEYDGEHAEEDSDDLPF